MSDSKTTSMYATPASGATITVPQFDGKVMTVFLDPPGLLATLSISMPASKDGQVIYVMSSKAITLLSLSAVGATILSAVTSLLANSSFTYAYSENAGGWFRIG